MNRAEHFLAATIIAGSILLAVTAKATGVIMEPMGIKNNNPGDLRPLGGSSTWLGQVGELNGYLQFDSMVHGIRASAINLFNYARRDGVTTIAEMSARWAPSGDHNDPTSYANIVAAESGYAVDAQIDFAARTVNALVLRGIFIAETGYRLPGIPWVTVAQISAGQQAAENDVAWY